MKLLFLLLSCTIAFGQGFTARRVAAPFVIHEGTPHATLNSGLTVYYKFEESSGTRVDSEPTGTAQDLTDNATVTSVAGKIGNAAWFTSANAESLSRNDSSDISVGNQNFYWSVWVYLESKGGNRDIVAKWGATSGNFEYLLRFNNTSDRYEWFVSDSGSSVFSVVANNHGSPAIQTWTHIFFYHDTDTDVIGISVNNGAANTVFHSAGVFDGGSVFGVGSRQPNAANFWNGGIDELALWKRLLTTEEKAAVYNAGAGKFYGPPFYQ